jgi:mycofactocin system glycosyltransferase
MTEEGNPPSPAGVKSVDPPDRAPSPSCSGGRYRLRDEAQRNGSLLVTTRPLVVTRLNDAAVAVVETLHPTDYCSPATVAAETGLRREAVANLLAGLHSRGFLQWRPGRDPDYRPPVSVVVTVRNDGTPLRHCLDALADLDYPEYEVIVVDDGSTDETSDVVASHPLDLRLVSVGAARDPLGIGASRNRGVGAARHEVVAFTDADCRPRSDWLAALVPALGSHDVVGGRVRPSGQGPISVYEGINSSLDMGPRAARVRPGSETPYLPTANLLARRSVLQEIGFPERNVAEDVGFCWAALESGHDVVYDPEGVVDHDYGESGKRFSARRSAYGASEALLTTEFPSPGAVSIPPIVALAAIAAAMVAVLFAGLASLDSSLPVVGSVIFSSATAAGTGLLVGGLVALVGAGRPIYRAYRRAGGAVSRGAVLASLRRRALSTAYRVSREVTRYYAIPLGGLATVLVVVGAVRPGTTALAAIVVGCGTTLWGLLLVAVTLPAVVEYAIHRPAGSPAAFLRWYLLDHLAYGVGVYRGALAHRTAAHLDPRTRFRLG